MGFEDWLGLMCKASSGNSTVCTLWVLVATFNWVSEN